MHVSPLRMVVIASLTIAALLTISFVSPRGQMSGPSDGGMACKTDLATIATAVEAYHLKTGSYPRDLDPTLTDPGPSQFLRPEEAMTGDSYQRPTYTITYDPTTGTVSSSSSC